MSDRGDPWQAMADVLEAQAWAADARARDAQSEEQVAADRATWTLAERLRAAHGGASLHMHLTGGHGVGGVVRSVGEDWVFLGLPHGVVHALVHLPEIVAVSGLLDAGRAHPPDPFARAGVQLRAWRDAGCDITVLLRDGRTLTSSVRHVQADHVDLHAPDAGVVAMSAISAIVVR